MATERKYLDANPADFTDKVQGLLAEQRAIYQMDKDIKAKIVAAMNEELGTQGEVVLGITYTRWGQMQLIMGEKSAKVSTAKARPTLAAYLAANADRQS